MNFNSPEYAIFLPLVVFGFFVVMRHERARDILLLSASYYFYMSWNWKFAGLILFSTLIDYWVGLTLSRSKIIWQRKLLLLISLASNLGILGIFKYYDFGLGVTEQWLFLGSVDLAPLRLQWLLPVGISFYTFQTLSYTIDLYRREIEAERSFIKFAIFVSFFPQLVAGPIVRAKEFLPQLHREPEVSRSKFNASLFLVMRGLVKKVIIADLLSKLAVDQAFAEPTAFSSWDLLFAIYGYAFQIYNDFSGYSDIAIGSAGLLGFTLPLNFNRPYLAEGIQDFWKRWHITLSTWIRDYLYFPLGGSRGSKARTAVNLLITMFLAGLWHGAAINFAIWGLFHGLLLVFAHLGIGVRLPYSWLRRFACFHLVCLGWLIFRISNWATFVDYLRGLSSLTFESHFHILFYAVLALAISVHVLPKKTLDHWCVEFPTRWPAPAQGVAIAFLILSLCACSIGGPSFIYFQF